MRRIFSFFFRREERGEPACSFTLSEEQRGEILAVLADIGLEIVCQTNGPVPLYKFARMVMDRLRDNAIHEVPVEEFADALKRVIRDMNHEKLTIISPSDFPGVGYVYNVRERETWPVRSSR